MPGGFDEIDRRFARPAAPREIKREAPAEGDPCPERDCRGEMRRRFDPFCPCRVAFIPCASCATAPIVCTGCGWRFEEPGR